MDRKNIKICFFIPSLNAGGAEKMLIKLANHFAKNNDFSIYFIVLKKGVLIKELNLKDIELINLHKKRALYSIFSLARVLKNIQPDVIFSALGHANISAVIANMVSRTNTRVIISERSTISNAPLFSGGIKSNINKVIYKFFYLRSDGIVAISNGVKEDLIKTLSIPENKISVIYNPAYPENTEQVIPINYSKLLNNKKTKFLITVGRLEKAKDFLTLLKSISLIRSSPIHLFILGEGSERPLLEKYIIENNLSGIVTLLGFVEKPCRWLKSADLYLCSSAWEGFGNSIVEAMACGLPIVSTNCVGPKEILGDLTKLVPVGDEVLMAKAILNALQGQKTDIFKDRAKHFSIDKISEQYLEVLMAGMYIEK